MIRILLALGLALGVAACSGGSGFDALNIFEAKDPEAQPVALVPEGGWPQDQDRRLMISQVTSLKIERTSAGVIVHATGLPPRLGYWDAELVPDNEGDPVKGVMSYTFRIASPRWATRASTPYARTVEVAAFIPTRKLDGISSIRVVGENNALTARR